jgi:hypothetical protein
MNSPDGHRKVIKAEYSEVRMGSPPFGAITVTGGHAHTKGRMFGEPMAFSRDSRYLAVEELMGVTSDGGPHTRVVVFDLDKSTEFVVHDERGGLIHEVSWDTDGSLSLVAWSYPRGRSEHRAAWIPIPH